MPRKSRLSNNRESKNEMKDSKFKAILADFDSKVKSRLEELDDKVKEYCDEIANDCNSVLARIPKNHQNMLILDFIDMKNKAQEVKADRMDTSDDVFENVAAALTKNVTPACDEPSNSSGNGNRSPRFLKPSTKKRLATKKGTAASVENLTSAGRHGSTTRAARTRSAKERSASESRAASSKRMRDAAGSALSGAFAAIRSHSRHRTPDTKLSTPLRKCRAGERCLILSESGSPLSNGNEPTIVCPTRDGTMVTMSSRNMDYLDEDTRENLKIIHSKLTVLLDRI